MNTNMYILILFGSNPNKNRKTVTTASKQQKVTTWLHKNEIRKSRSKQLNRKIIRINVKGTNGGGERIDNIHEKTKAAAAPRKPKKGAVSSPLNAVDIFFVEADLPTRAGRV